MLNYTLSEKKKNGLNSNQYVVLALCVLAAVLLSTWSDWQALCCRRDYNALCHRVLPPFNTWSKYTIYTSVLKHGHAVVPLSISSRFDKRRRGSPVLTVLCTLLLLCGDIHLNPGPSGGEELTGETGVSPMSCVDLQLRSQ